MRFKVVFNNQSGDEIVKSVMNEVVEVMEKKIKKALEPFRKEIEDNNGLVILKITEGMDFNLQIEEVPNGLVDRITEELG